MYRVIYQSRGGNTKKVADAIASALGVKAEPVASADAVSAGDTLFIGGGIYADSLNPALRSFTETLTPDSVGRVAVFGTKASSKSDVCAKLKSALEHVGVTPEAECFCCHGKFLWMNRKRPNADDLKTAAAFAKRVTASK